MARRSWIEAGQEPIKLYQTNDRMARIASIKLTFNSGKFKNNFFLLSVYTSDSNYEKEFPYEDFLENLADAVKNCPQNHTLILGIDVNCKLGRSDNPPP